MTTTKARTGLVAATAFSILFASFGAAALRLEEKQILTEIRGNIFGGSRLAAAFEQATISGAEPAIFPLEAESRGLLVWKIPEADAQSFAREIGLPPPFTLKIDERIRPDCLPMACGAAVRVGLSQTRVLQPASVLMPPERGMRGA